MKAKRAQAHQSISLNDRPHAGHARGAALPGLTKQTIISTVDAVAILDRDTELLAAKLKSMLVNKNLALALAAYLEKTRFSMTF